MSRDAVKQFKKKLMGNETTILLNSKYAVGSIVEFFGTLGVDAVMLDCEQGTASFDAIEDCVRACRVGNVASIVRVPSAEPPVIERHLYRGVDGVVIPRLDFAAQVEKAMVDIRYCFGRDFDERVTIVQVESASALKELDGFLEVPDIDCYFVGGIDLAKSLGYMGDYHRPEVVREIERAFDCIRRAGKTAGMMVRPDDIEFWTERGATMLFVVSHDLLTIGAQHFHRVLSGQRNFS